MEKELAELCLRTIAGLENHGSSLYPKLITGEKPERKPREESCSEYNERLLRLCKEKACELLAIQIY